MTAPSIVIAGSVNVDFTLRVERLPHPNETITGKDMAVAIGGKGLNQAVACARLGANAHMIAAVGSDNFATQATTYMSVNGVNTAHLHAVAGCATGVANIFVADDGQNMIVVTPGANARLTPAMITSAEDTIARAQALIVQLETPLESVQRALELARRHAVFTVLNPAPVVAQTTALFPLVDLVTPNEIELMALTGISGQDDASLTAALNRLTAQGARQALVTLGDRGAATLIAGRLHRVPAFRVKAVDATGAGDHFNGALVSCLVRGAELIEAMRFASAAAALSVMRPSADSAPTMNGVESFLSAQ
ncbi:MAG: ribokinase [Asticcacaulis sp.]